MYTNYVPGKNTIYKFTSVMMMITTVIQMSQFVLGWTAAEHCTNGIITFYTPRYGGRFRFWGRPVVHPCWLAGSAPHKSGRCQVKSRPDHTLQSHGLVTYATTSAHNRHRDRLQPAETTSPYSVCGHRLGSCL